MHSQSQSQYSPSFSSSLLDAIYRSIDQGDDKMLLYREAIRNSNARARTRASAASKSDEEMANFRRACMIEKWMEKKATEKAVVRRKSAADSHTKKPRKSDRPPSSSWSHAAGERAFFSSSEPESLPLPRPKPVRTGASGLEKDPSSDPKHEAAGGFLKTKSRALKFYGDLKKAKQPISPGGKLAGFLNSIFTGKSKMESPSLKSTNASSTCSSASSFSRSCLSKTPSSRGKSSNGAKRSVRFSQADEDDCGHNKSVLRNELTSRFDSRDNRIRNVINEELMVHVMEKNQVARDLLRNYQMKTQTGRREFEFDNLKKSNVKNKAFGRDFEEDDEDEDAASYASSDLFELDNLSSIGNMERFREELPVYESTRLDRTNRAGGLVF